jgi:homospermidine synthase
MRSFVFLVIVLSATFTTAVTSAVAQSRNQQPVQVPDCFNNPGAFPGAYIIEFDIMQSPYRIQEKLQFLKIVGVETETVDYQKRVAKVGVRGIQMLNKQSQNSTMAALTVLQNEGSVTRISCVGLMGPRPRIGVGN